MPRFLGGLRLALFWGLPLVWREGERERKGMVGALGTSSDGSGIGRGAGVDLARGLKGIWVYFCLGEVSV